MYQHIMVTLDGSELAECVLPHVVAIGGGCSVSRITLIQVIPPFHLYAYAEDKLPPKWRNELEADVTKRAEEYLNKKAAELKEKGITAETKVLQGSAPEMLVEFANKEGVDLIVLSTHGRSGVSRWVWGSVADRLLRSACVPVLMVRAPGCYPGI